MEKLEYNEIYEETTMKRLKDEFSRLKDIAYLDHTGATLYSNSLVKKIAEDLSNNLYGNPHALNSSSKFSSDVVEQVRERVLAHFKTDSSKYSVIFTSGATAALKLVAQTFDWGKQGSFVYLKESHTSVLGMRELALVAGATTMGISSKNKISGKDLNSGNCLFAYPAQCNFSGFKYPLQWIDEMQHKSKTCAVMLDAAAYVATSTLDLSKVKPDFVCISFYKLFGLPTGLGALLVKKESETFLKKTYFGGGTVLMARSDQNIHVPRPNFHEWFEDGTIPFLSIAALRHGFDCLLDLIPGGMPDVETHTFNLARYLHHSLASLRHSNGKPVAILYCDSDFEDQKTQGSIVNFNLLRADGSYIGFSEVLHMCNLFGVHVRTGCFCNPGACQRHLGLSDEELDQHFEAGHVCGDSVDIVAGKPTGSVRVSLGYCSTMQDVDKLLALIRKCFLEVSHSPVTLTTLTLRIGEPRLSRILLYPVKSCGAQDVASWTLDSRGLKGDRAWMITTDAGVALTQKNEPRMCLIKPKLDLTTQTLTLSFLGMENVSVPFLPSNENKDDGNSKVCGARVQTSDCGNQVAEWLSLALERSGLRLLRQWPTDKRTQKKSAADLSLANQAQFLLVGMNSLAWLEQRVKERVQQEDAEQEIICEGEELLHRFRSNLVVSGVPEFQEKEWKTIKIGSVVLKAEGPCTRCQMVCISQSSGLKTTEPLRTLTASSEGRMQFGSYFSQVGTQGTLYVGSPVTSINLDESNLGGI